MSQASIQSANLKAQVIEDPAFDLLGGEDHVIFKATGSWTLETIGRVDRAVTKALKDHEYHSVDYDLTGVTDMDTAGAYVLARATRCDTGACFAWDLTQPNKGQRMLIQAAADARMGRPPDDSHAWYDMLVRMGVATEKFWKELYDTLAFLGQFMTVLGKMIVQPHRIRWKSVVALIEEVGLDAAPIVMVLSFFIGAVLAYMGANLLASFGAQIFMVELVGFAMLREFAVLITAILLAGRSDSAFTAQIGAMKMRQEIDAMTVIGLDTFETLVAPRAIACLVAAPILTFLAMISGVFGGMLVAWLGPTDITPVLFLARMRETVEINNFWVGMVKAPFFALIIAIIGCRQGLAVTGSVDSLGQRTTSSVVQAIFAVITLDAMFAMLFLELGV